MFFFFRFCALKSVGQSTRAAVSGSTTGSNVGRIDHLLYGSFVYTIKSTVVLYFYSINREKYSQRSKSDRFSLVVIVMPGHAALGRYFDTGETPGPPSTALFSSSAEGRGRDFYFRTGTRRRQCRFFRSSLITTIIAQTESFWRVFDDPFATGSGDLADFFSSRA